MSRKWSVLLASVSLLTLSACAGNDHTLNNNPASLEQAYSKNMESAASARSAGNLKMAASHYTRAASLNQTNASPLVALADVLWEMKNPTEAARVLERARQLEPGSLVILRNLGRAYVAAGNANAGREMYALALDIDSQDVRSHSGMGVALDLLGDHRAAQASYRNGLGIEPLNIELQNNLAYSLILSKDYNKAIDILEPLVNSPAGSARQRQNLSMAYALSGNESDARRIAAIDLTPVQVKRNMDVYRDLRANGHSKELLREVGAPTFERGGLNPKSSPIPATAAPPAAPETATIEAVATPAAAEAPVTVAEQLKEEANPEPTPLTPPRAAQTADTAAPEASPPVAAAAEITPLPAPVPVAASQPTETTPPSRAQAERLQPPTSDTRYSLGNGKVYLGSFPSEASARQQWIKTWTENSTTLGSLVAGIEQAAGGFALYGIGADSPEAARMICEKLRENGVSCGP